MRIETKTVYLVGKAEFESEKAARQWIADQIGRTIDKALSDAGKTIGPGNAIAVNDAMLKNSATLSTLLSAYAAPIEES